MGDIGNLLFGGSKQGSQNTSTGSSSTTSQNQSQNSSVQGSVNNSSNSQGAASNSNGYNLSYGPVAAAMAPTLGYTSAGGNMLGALLGVPGYSATKGPPVAVPTSGQTYHPPAPVAAPKPPASSNSGTSALTSLIGLLSKASTPTATPAPTTTPVPVATTAPTLAPTTIPTPVGSPTRVPIAPHGIPYYADGGPIAAGQPAIVGEHQPEMFVPTQPGMILPSVPGKGPDGRFPPVGAPPMNGGGFNFPRGPHGPDMHGHGGVTPPGVVPPITPVTPTAPAAPSAPVDPNPQGTALNNYFNSSGGQFLMQQGQNAINSNASAGGFLQSGATGVALQKLGQGLASTYMNDYINHLLDFSKLGLGGASAMSGAGSVNNSNSSSYGSGSSSGASYGNSAGSSSGSSTGTSNSQGTGSSSGTSKKGIVPDILG